MKIIFFGVSKIALDYLKKAKHKDIILAFADNRYEEIQNAGGHLVISPESILKYDFDYVVIALDDQKKGNIEEIWKIYTQLIKMGVPKEKILLQSFKYYLPHILYGPRTRFVYDLSRMFQEKGIDGAVAECGVFRGWFSGVLSNFFPNNKLYLFDTFSGFQESDMLYESDVAKDWVAKAIRYQSEYATPDLIKLRCINKERVIIKKGYVPETLQGINEQFCFVNLDMDVKQPQLAALEFFASRIVESVTLT